MNTSPQASTVLGVSKSIDRKQAKNRILPHHRTLIAQEVYSDMFIGYRKRFKEAQTN
jgi:hypothetical protein